MPFTLDNLKSALGDSLQKGKFNEFFRHTNDAKGAHFVTFVPEVSEASEKVFEEFCQVMIDRVWKDVEIIQNKRLDQQTLHPARTPEREPLEQLITHFCNGLVDGHEIGNQKQLGLWETVRTNMQVTDLVEAKFRQFVRCVLIRHLVRLVCEVGFPWKVSYESEEEDAS